MYPRIFFSPLTDQVGRADKVSPLNKSRSFYKEWCLAGKLGAKPLWSFSQGCPCLYKSPWGPPVKRDPAFCAKRKAVPDIKDSNRIIQMKHTDVLSSAVQKTKDASLKQLSMKKQLKHFPPLWHKAWFGSRNRTPKSTKPKRKEWNGPLLKHRADFSGEGRTRRQVLSWLAKSPAKWN